MAYAPGSDPTSRARTMALAAAKNSGRVAGAPADPMARLAGVQKALGNRLGRQRMPNPGQPGGTMQSVTGGGLRSAPPGATTYQTKQGNTAWMDPSYVGAPEGAPRGLVGGGPAAEMETMTAGAPDPMGAGLPPRLQAAIASGAMSPQGAANRFSMFKAGQLPGQQGGMGEASMGFQPGGNPMAKPGGPMQALPYPEQPQPGQGGGMQSVTGGGLQALPFNPGQLPPQFQQLILQRLQSMGMPQGNYGNFFGPPPQGQQGQPQFAYRGGY